jgi:hypothetical protein
MKKHLRTLVGLAVLAVLLLPLLLYVWQFGGQLSPHHSRWGEFGSAMSGIYTPLLAVATLVVLIMKVRLQAQMHDYQRDEAFVLRARADVEFYAQRLQAALAAKVQSGESLRDVVRADFQPPSRDELDSQRLRSLAEEVDAAFPELLALTYAVQAVLAGLSATCQRRSKSDPLCGGVAEVNLTHLGGTRAVGAGVGL